MAQARFTQRKDGLQARELFGTRGIHGRLRRSGGGLPREELVVRAAGGRDRDAQAEESGAGVAAARRLQIDRLPGIAVHRRVGDVVAGGLQRGVAGLHGLHADGDKCRDAHG